MLPGQLEIKADDVRALANGHRHAPFDIVLTIHEDLDHTVGKASQHIDSVAIRSRPGDVVAVNRAGRDVQVGNRVAAFTWPSSLTRWVGMDGRSLAWR